MSDGQTKQFGKGQRLVPAQKAQKWYPVDDESQPKKVSETPGHLHIRYTHSRKIWAREVRSDQMRQRSRRISLECNSWGEFHPATIHFNRTRRQLAITNYDEIFSHSRPIGTHQRKD